MIKVQRIQTVEYDSALGSKEILTQVTPWASLQDITPSETGPSQNTDTVRVHLDEVPREDKLMRDKKKKAGGRANRKLGLNGEYSFNLR